MELSFHVSDYFIKACCSGMFGLRKLGKMNGRTVYFPLLLVLAGCGVGPSRSMTAEKAEVKPPADESALFPLTGLVGSKVVADHLLGKSFLPGGTVADYEKGYQLFAIREASA
ncbi:MAG: hypothetical protein M3Z36_11220 [Acidobacteriota bacterium]|nr:hypothetical protein [Acidobacteriota bacterium]